MIANFIPYRTSVPSYTMKKTLIPFLFVVVALLSSCVSREKIVYYQNIEKNNTINTKQFASTIQPDDLLMIIVSAQDPLAAAPYNLLTDLSVRTDQQAGTGRRQQQLYLVDGDGYIDFPVIGRIKMGGKTEEEVSALLYTEVSKGILDPVINLRIMNFKVTVLGEVRKPGVHKINSERITLPEALSLSGDLTTYGKRNNIIITREENGKINTHKVDLTKADFINSDFYYLKQNDVVYVEPNSTKVNSSGVGANVSIYITVVSLLLTATALILTNSK